MLRRFNPDFPVESDGSFVIGGLEAGRYYLAALEHPSIEVQLLNEMRREGLTLTYYPNSVKFESAAPIDIQPGREVRDIRMIVQKTSLLMLAGKAASPLRGARVLERRLWLCAKDPSGALSLLQAPEKLVNATGAFAFHSVPPGDYVIWGDTKIHVAGHGRTFTAQQEVHVIDGNSSGIDVAFTPAVKLTGKVRGQATSPVPGAARMFAGLHDPLNPLSDTTDIGADGSFVLQVPPGEYRVFAGNGTQTTKAATSILFRGREVLGAPVQVTSAGGAIEVVFSHAAEIRGVVRDQNRQTVAGATVALWRAGAFAISGAADATGRFRLTGLPPGSFRIAAWEDLDSGIAGSPRFRGVFEKQSVGVSVAEGSRIVVDLRVISAASTEPVVASLQ